MPYRILPDIDVPVPYMRWNERTGIVIVANRSTEADAHLRLNIPVDKLGPTLNARYAVTDLWNGGPQIILSAQALSDFHSSIRPDKTIRGGLGVIKIERLN